MALTYFPESIIQKDKIEAAWLQGVRLPETESQLIDLCVYDPLFVAQLLVRSVQQNDEFVIDHLIHHLAPYAKYLAHRPSLEEHQAWKIIANHRPWYHLIERHLARLPKYERIWKEQVHREERVLFETRAAISQHAN